MVDRPGSDASRSTVHPANRGLLGIVRLLVAVVLLVGLTVATVAVVPQVVDEVVYQGSSIETDPPPAAGDRNPELQHAGDPGNTTFEAETTVRSDHVEDFIHYEVNDIRIENGLEPIVWDGTIASVARAHSADMAEREYFAHENPDGQGPMDRFETTADYCHRYGENIAQNWLDRDVRSDSGEVDHYETAEGMAAGLVEQWMNSEPHREAILTEGWDRGGVGVYITDDGAVYATHNFCTEW